MSDSETATWTLTITRYAHSSTGEPKTITHVTTDVNGHGWQHINGSVWQFNASGWDAIVSDVITAVDERRVGDETSPTRIEKVGDNGANTRWS